MTDQDIRRIDWTRAVDQESERGDVAAAYDVRTSFLRRESGWPKPHPDEDACDSLNLVTVVAAHLDRRKYRREMRHRYAE